MEDEVKRCLGLLGVNGFDAVNRSYLRPAAPTLQSTVLSAFPLLEVDRWRYY